MRRLVSQLFFWICPAVTAVAVWLMWHYTVSGDFRQRVLADYGLEREAYFVPFFYLAAIEAAVLLLGYALSLDARARRRPWIEMSISAFTVGATFGAALWGFIHEGFDAVGWAAAAAIGAVAAGLLLGFEFLNRWLWQSIVLKMDQKNLGGPALQFSRLALLWRPGQDALLLSVAMEQFRRGQRGETAEALRKAYEGGNRSPDLLELLCQLAAEEKKSAEYLKYLGDLFRQFPDDTQLRDAYRAELLEQGKNAEALALMEKHGVPGDEQSLEEYARLLVDARRLDGAVDVAKRLGELEGIPMRRADAVLRMVLAENENHLGAINLLADWAERMVRRDQQIRWLDRSLIIDPSQHDRGLKLAELLEQAEQPQRLERLLESLVAQQPENLEMRFRHARTVYSNGKLEEAARLLEDILRRGYDKQPLYELLAQTYFELNKLEEARGAADRGLKKHPPKGDKSPLDLLLRKIERAVLTAELSQLIEQAEKQPEKLEPQIQVIERLVHAGHAERAVAFCDSTLHHHPNARSRVIELVEKAVLEQPEGGYALLSYIADLKVQESQFDEALDTVKLMAERSLNPLNAMREGAQKILRRSPHHLKTLRLMGDLYKEQGQFTEMIHSYSLYLANGGEESEELDRSLAEAYMSINDYVSARRFVKSLLESAGDDEEAIERNVALLKRVVPMAIASGHAAEAAEFQQKLEHMAPADKETRAMRSVVDEALGNERFGFLKRELESGKGDQKTLEELGNLCLEKEEYNQAITYFQRAARIPGSNRIPKVKLAYSFARKRMFDLAGETLAELTLSLNDDPEELDQLMHWIYRTGEVLEEAHMFDRASKLYKQLMKIDAGYKDVLQRVERLSKR